MSGHSAIIGVDDRIDENGESHPWRIVTMSRALPARRVQHLMALPPDRRYLSVPRHPLYGDLTRIGETAHRQVAELVKMLCAVKVGHVHLDERHRSRMLGTTLIWNGIEPMWHRIDHVDDGMLRDPFSIGGAAGHQIAMIEMATRNAR